LLGTLLGAGGRRSNLTTDVEGCPWLTERLP